MIGACQWWHPRGFCLCESSMEFQVSGMMWCQHFGIVVVGCVDGCLVLQVVVV